MGHFESPERQPRPPFRGGLERPRLVAPVGPHEAGDLGGELEVLEGPVVDVDALHAVLDVPRDVSDEEINVLLVWRQVKFKLNSSFLESARTNASGTLTQLNTLEFDSFHPLT